MYIGRVCSLSVKRQIWTIWNRSAKDCFKIRRILPKLLTPIYGIKVAGRFEELFTQHLTIAADLLDAAKKGEVSKADAIRNRWYKNADEIAGFLASVNPCWDKARWKDMLYSHLETTEEEALLRFQGDYTADINMFDRIENEAYKMADYMFCGIIKKCYR